MEGFMKRIMVTGLALAVMSGGGSAALAVQDKVIDVLNAPQPGQSVSLKGRLIEDQGGYKFRDETGEINISVAPKLVPSNALADNAEVEIVGNVETPKEKAPQVNAGMVMVTQTIVETAPAEPTGR
jgi:uncharacterized protein YdeI (BOF family)